VQCLLINVNVKCPGLCVLPAAKHSVHLSTANCNWTRYAHTICAFWRSVFSWLFPLDSS